MRPDPASITQLVNAAYHKDTHLSYKNHVVSISDGAGKLSGPTIHVPSASSSQRPGQMKLNPLVRSRSNGYTTEHQLYEAENARYRQLAYAKGGDTLSVHISICYQSIGRKELTELPKLSDMFKDFDAHLSSHAIQKATIDHALVKLQVHQANLAPGFIFKWNTAEFNLRDISKQKIKQIGAGTDLDGLTVKIYGSDNPYLLTYGHRLEKGDKKWKPPKTPVYLRVEISAEEYNRFDEALTEYQEFQDHPSDKDSEGDDNDHTRHFHHPGSNLANQTLEAELNYLDLNAPNQIPASSDLTTANPIQVESEHVKITGGSNISKRARSGSLASPPRTVKKLMFGDHPLRQHFEPAFITVDALLAHQTVREGD
ncbi:hypothetical protein E1B28_011367 [Marasmius oreades]|uniref:Uncharacterized protein n=1 Tax=Marasmius oreades TaxID=181124 RepID=A0A9P7RU50_9AGAR|nr:uncharacterized protein E1B28_011367 [Marasmius oreades]KAG7089712.1 hypothetical protein E1B28_011367 [Marasmius oreades]